MKQALQPLAMVLLLLAAGCTGSGSVSPASQANTVKLAVDPALLDPGLAKRIPTAEMTPPVAVKPTADVAVAIPLPTPIQPAEIKSEAGGIGIKIPSGMRPSVAPDTGLISAPSISVRATPTTPRLAMEAPARVEIRPPVAKTAEPTLDLAALKTRLRDTTAIGIFTKLALKNQMDDLLNKFRSYYENGQKTNVSLLRQPYNDLVAKLLALVQDGDPSLARTIAGSRDAIWGILADAEKFKAEI